MANALLLCHLVTCYCREYIMPTKLTIPISEQQSRSLKIGDQVLLNGVIFTGRSWPARRPPRRFTTAIGKRPQSSFQFTVSRRAFPHAPAAPPARAGPRPEDLAKTLTPAGVSSNVLPVPGLCFRRAGQELVNSMGKGH